MTRKRKKKSISVEDTQRLLGADEPVLVPPLPPNPFGWKTFAAVVRERLVSQGGRPTDPAWTIVRKVPMTPETWHRLTDAAKKTERRATSIAPGQLAAVALEEGLASLTPHRVAIAAQRTSSCSLYAFSEEARAQGHSLALVIQEKGVW